MVLLSLEDMREICSQNTNRDQLNTIVTCNKNCPLYLLCKHPFFEDWTNTDIRRTEKCLNEYYKKEHCN